MFILVQHQVTDPKAFWSDAQKGIANMPPHLKLHHTFSATDGTKAACVWEATSVDTLKTFLEPAVGRNSRNDYFEVVNKEGIGLPASMAKAV